MNAESLKQYLFGWSAKFLPFVVIDPLGNGHFSTVADFIASNFPTGFLKDADGNIDLQTASMIKSLQPALKTRNN